MFLKRLHTQDITEIRQKFNLSPYRHNPIYRNQVKRILSDCQNLPTADNILDKLKSTITMAAAQLNEILTILSELDDSVVNFESLSLCHTDIHAGNILKSDDGNLYIIDWDLVTLGPKELDLLFIGGGIAGLLSREDEIASFYSGYGNCDIDYKKLAFYRFARVIEDIALFYQQIINTSLDYQTRYKALQYLESNFNKNETIDCAFKALNH